MWQQNGGASKIILGLSLGKPNDVKNTFQYLDENYKYNPENPPFDGTGPENAAKGSTGAFFWGNYLDYLSARVALDGTGNPNDRQLLAGLGGMTQWAIPSASDNGFPHGHCDPCNGRETCSDGTCTNEPEQDGGLLGEGYVGQTQNVGAAGYVGARGSGAGAMGAWNPVFYG